MTAADRLLHRIPFHVDYLGVELGVLRGENAARLLAARPQLRLILVDDWSLRGMPDELEDDAKSLRRQAREQVQSYRERVQWIEKDSEQAALEVPPGTLDFAFLDADHAKASTYRDICLWSARVKPGGWIGGHDYGHPRLPGVAQAVDLYADRYKLPIHLDGSCWFFHLP